MKRSIYSLVLADDVVAAVDRMAYEMHTSRSNLINQILAEHLSCVTPEMRMQAIFEQMNALAGQFRVLEQTSAHMLSLQSQLNYRYKPTVQYYIELYRTPQDDSIGRLRVQFRTQNEVLLCILEQFFLFWTKLEERYVPGSAGTVFRLSPGRLERTIRDPGVSEEELGELIGGFVQVFDRYLRAWFAGIAFAGNRTPPPKTVKQLEASFQKEAQKLEKSI